MGFVGAMGVLAFVDQPRNHISTCTHISTAARTTQPEAVAVEEEQVRLKRRKKTNFLPELRPIPRRCNLRERKLAKIAAPKQPRRRRLSKLKPMKRS